MRQGWASAPGKGAHFRLIQFNIYAEAMLLEALWDVDESICVGGHLSR